MEDMLRFQQEMKEIEANPNPRGGKRVGSEVWYDLKLSLPLGLRLDTAPGNNIVGVSEVLEGGSAWEHNEKNTWTAPDNREDAEAQGFGTAEGLANFVQVGDRLISVNGQKVRTQEEVVDIVQQVEEGGTVTIRFGRQSRGPITVVFPYPARRVVVAPKTRLMEAAFSAGHYLDLTGCEDSCDGSCWHLDERSNEIYQLCVESCIACEIPSNGGVGNLGKQVAAFAQVAAGNEAVMTTFDNTEPLVLRRCPEIYERLNDPYVGTWVYPGGRYTIVRNGDVRTFKEKGEIGDFSVEMKQDGEWLIAELEPHGSLRVRPAESFGITFDMESQFRPAGGEWGEMTKAFRG